MTSANLPPVACETGKTGGGLPQTLAAFFHRFTKPAITSVQIPSPPTPLQAMFATQVWDVTWRHQNGDIYTITVLISGAWLMAEITEKARDALHAQHDISNAQILRLTMHCSQQ